MPEGGNGGKDFLEDAKRLIDEFPDSKEVGGKEIDKVVIDGAKKIAEHCFYRMEETGYPINNETLLKRFSAAALYEMKNQVENNPEEFGVGEQYSNGIRIHGYNTKVLSEHFGAVPNTIFNMAGLMNEHLNRIRKGVNDKKKVYKVNKIWIYE